MSSGRLSQRSSDGIAALLFDTDTPTAVSIINSAFSIMSVVSGATFVYRDDVGSAPRIELMRACVWIETEYDDEWINVFTIEAMNGTGPDPLVTFDPFEAGRSLLSMEAKLEAASAKIASHC